MTTTVTTTTAAPVIFVEESPVWFSSLGVRGEYMSRWTVRFLNRDNVLGEIGGRLVPERGTSVILTVRETPDGFMWTTFGESRHPGGTRHHHARDFGDMQKRVLAWASRRFRVETEGAN